MILFLPYMNILASSTRRNKYNSLAENGQEGCIYQGPRRNKYIDFIML
jgi:hypothetical protein